MFNKAIISSLAVILFSFSLQAQVKKQDTGLKREVTLYNPYKPALPDSKKKSFLPDMNDTTKIKPVFSYDVKTTAFLPEYTVSPIKAAALLPDPLTKLYKSFVKLGLGNYMSPLAEVSITNERSKTGSIGFYGRHFSTNGNIDLDNGKKGFAGYMDNDASLFGRRFFRKNAIEGSIDYSGKTRYAYGYAPTIINYDPAKKEIRIPYNNIGGKASFYSTILDSTELSYNFKLSYDYFSSPKNLNQRKFTFSGNMATTVENFFVGAGLSFNHYKVPDFVLENPKYVFSIAPYVTKGTDLWNIRLGLQALLDRNLSSSAKFHAYPDVYFGIAIVPSYINFFASLTGKLEINEPMSIITINPYLLTDGSLYKLPNTSHDMVVKGGLKGNTGMGGNYLVSVSYSLISNMLFYSNVVVPDSVLKPWKGSYFAAPSDDVELLNVHGEINGPITDKLTYFASANIYKYTLSKFDYAWNKPDWDGMLSFKYNLRDKILAGVEMTLEGRRRIAINQNILPLNEHPVPMILPTHFNMNLSAEYRYSKILSFWARLNHISNKRYYDWAYYPTQRFMFMAGFTYSL